MKSRASRFNHGLQRLLSRMPIRWRLVTAMAVLLVPLFGLGYWYIESKSDAIHAVRLEQDGFEYLEPLDQFMRRLARHRGLTNIYLHGGRALLPEIRTVAEQADQSLTQLDSQDARLDTVLKTREKLTAIKSAWIKLKGDALSLAPHDSFERHTALIRQALDLNEFVAETSGMIIDPRPETYYLMDAIILHGHKFIERLGQLRGWAAGVVQKGTLDPADRVGVTDRMTNVVDDFQDVKRSFASVYRYLPATQVEIEPGLMATENKLNAYLGNMERLSHGEALGLTALQVFADGSNTLNEYYRLDETADRIFARVLDGIVADLQHDELVAISVLAGAVAIALLIAFISVRSVTGPVRHMVNVVDRLTQGDNDVRTWLDTGDEIGVLARQFDKMMDERQQREATLADSEERFRQMSENIRDIFCLIDVKSGRALYVSPAYQEITGRNLTRPDIEPLEWFEAVHPGDRDHIAKQFQQRIATGWLDYEYRILRPDGEIRYMHARGYPVFNTAGDAYRIATIAADITIQKLAEEKVKRLNRVYAVLSGINTLIVRVRDRDELFREACRIAVELGQFVNAHIVMIDPVSRQMRLMGSYSRDPRYMEELQKLFRIATPEAQAIFNRIVEQREPLIMNDTVRELPAQFQGPTHLLGTGSSAVLQLVISDRVAGFLALDAREAGFFDTQEMKLLLELAGDIAFALDTLDKTEKLDYLAYYDQLTELANATLFRERLAQHLHGANGKQQRVGLALFDVERFKPVNDALGRHAGDELLKQLAGRLAGCVGNVDEAARLSADHFAFVLPEAVDERGVAHTIEECNFACFGEPFVIGEGEFKMAAKFGIALYPEDGADAETLFQNAEAALKKAKAGGERYLFHTQQMTERVAERLTLESKLRQALEHEEFVLHYQPKVELEQRRIVGMEALIRWNDPATGLVPPVQFIALLEETGLILEVGAWAMRRAVQDHAYWQASGLMAPRIAVNVSAIQLRQSDFVDVVRRSLAAGPSPPDIDIEITESLIMEDIEGNITKLKEIRDMGLNIFMDDFGTGYSSLAYLAQLPIQTLKIDRSFIITMLQDSNSMTLVSTIISLAHSLGLKVVAEGVDQEEQAKMLRLLRCDEMQGYLFSKPIPLAEVSVLIATKSHCAVA